jgi:hypothetical protein
MSAYPSTVYRFDPAGELRAYQLELDAAGNFHEVIVEETDEALQVDRTRVTMSAGVEPFDEIAWWSRQLGRPLSAA